VQLTLRKFFLRGLFLLFAFFALSSSAFAQGFDHSALDRFLKAYVDTAGNVNYAAAKNNHADLDLYLKQVENIDLKSFEAGPKPEVMAFWLNVYHAGLLALIIENYPLKSTEQIPSFWDRQFLKVGVRSLTAQTSFSLSQIRNEKLIVLYQDEKVHLALALAARHGPVFPREAFTGLRVLGQLYKSARREVARKEMVQIDTAAGRIQLSRVFEWYAPDFLKNFGRPERRGRLSRTKTAVVNFLIRYTKDINEVRFLKAAKFKLEFVPFDWTLNDAATVG